jgi:hypothetical protein
MASAPSMSFVISTKPPEALLWQRLQVRPLPLDQARPNLTFSPDMSTGSSSVWKRPRAVRGDFEDRPTFSPAATAGRPVERRASGRAGRLEVGEAVAATARY